MIQARTGSTRLPGKVLMPLANKPLILRLAERVTASPETGKIIFAVTSDKDDDELCSMLESSNLEVFRGDAEDLLDRHYKAALKFNADAVVKIPSDCPLIDPGIISKVINYFKIHFPQYDYVSNLHPATYPDGNDVEIMKMEALGEAWQKAARSFEREHTTPYFWENPGIFATGNVTWERGLDYSMSHRWTIDYKEDYEFIKTIYDELFNNNPFFGLDDILSLLERKPEIRLINDKFNGVNWYRHHLNELKTVSAEQTRQTEK